MSDYLATFILFFSVIDPVGTIPVFIATTNKHSDLIKAQIALRATLVAAGVLLFFSIFGQFLLEAIQVPLTAFQISGGIVLFLFALSMIFGDSKPEDEIKYVENHKETSVFPLAIPSLASPGAMLAAVLLTDNEKFGFTEQVITNSAMLLVLLVAYLGMRLSVIINRLIGPSGANVISRVMGLILSSIAVHHVLKGLREYF